LNLNLPDDDTLFRGRGRYLPDSCMEKSAAKEPQMHTDIAIDMMFSYGEHQWQAE